MMPPSPRGSVQEQLVRQYSYLFQMAQQLNVALGQLESGGTAAPSGGTAAPAAEREQQYQTLKSMIVKTADTVQRRMDQLSTKLTGEYVAASEFGTYVERLNAYLEANPEALTQYPFILLEEGDDYEIQEVLDTLGVQPNVQYRVQQDQVILAMVSCGLGISIMEELMLYRCAYPLVSCSLPQPFYRNIGICVKDRNALSNSTRAFIDHTRRWVLANFPDGWNAPPPTVR